MSATNSNAPKTAVYELKPIKFLGRRTQMILQNENGPCPLLGILNCLLLRNEINISFDYSRISYEDIIHILGDYFLKANDKCKNPTIRENWEHNVEDALNVLPKMQYGLDVNLKFRHIKDFEFTPELAVFDMFDIDLVHGWVVDPSETEMWTALEKLSYNHIMEGLFKMQELDQKEKNLLTPEQTQFIKQIKLADQFMNAHSNQLTFFGLTQLYEKIKENQLCVFFRNNHFSTMFKHEKNLYILLTDSGFRNEPVYWEKLDMVDNDTILCDHKFRPHNPHSEKTPEHPDDHSLAIKLHNDQVRQIQKEKKEQEFIKQQEKILNQIQKTGDKNNHHHHHHHHHHSNKKDDDCIIV